MVDKGTSTPLYIQVRDLVEADIQSGRYKYGDKIPSEKELCDRYDVSRVTVRQALEKLENSSIKELIVLDTIKLPTEKLERLSGKIKVLTVAHIFADAISRIHDGLSVSTLFS